MRIEHKIDEFLFTIFPDIEKNDNTALITKLQEYYTYGSTKPKVYIENDLIIVEINAPSIILQETDYRKTVALCEKGNYNEAKPILNKLIKTNPTNSEYHRIMGQIYSEEGDQEQAIDCLIDALKWDSKNEWALLMMGNIFAKFKDDVPTAIKYYDQAIIANPNNNIALNNIGANLMKQGKIQEAKKYLLEANRINKLYPNTYLTLGKIAELESDLQSAFDYIIQAIKLNNKKDALYQSSVKQAFDIANQIVERYKGLNIYNEYRYKLEFEGGTEIDIMEDTDIHTAAKIEFAENYNREKHLLRYNPNYPAIEHLIMHELVHLDFVIEARKNEINQLFIVSNEHKADFIKGIEPTINRLKKMGITESNIDGYCTSIFEGMSRQIFNTPIDLFIENFIYNEHPDLRPHQFISEFTIIQEGLKAVTDKQSVELTPKDILSKSKICNLVNAIQFKELYGSDFIKDFKATQTELKQAQKFYDEYLLCKDNKKPGEEYDLLSNWAEELKLDKYFELEGEIQYRKRSNIDTFLESLEKDPFGFEDKDPVKEREMRKFQKSQDEIGLNMAVVMFMVDALQYFDGMPKEQIHKIAFEIALQGTQGYRPDKDDYKINSIPGKIFSGYHILAYYYVSFALAAPEVLPDLNLPFDDEYKYAKSMDKPY